MSEMNEPEPAPLPSSTPQVSRRPGKAASEAAPVPAQVPQTAQHQPSGGGALNRAMLTPDRLDGHGFAPNRITQRETLHLYFVDEDPWDCPNLPHEVRLPRLRQRVGEYEAEIEEENDEDLYLELQPADVFLTGKAASSEISLKNLKMQKE